jgi:hypothetical protein
MNGRGRRGGGREGNENKRMATVKSRLDEMIFDVRIVLVWGACWAQPQTAARGMKRLNSWRWLVDAWLVAWVRQGLC